MTLALPPALADLSYDESMELFKQTHLAVWTERVRGFECAPFQWEWCELAMREQRLCLVAPRDHSKALALDTLVLRPDGTHTPIGRLRDVRSSDSPDTAPRLLASKHPRTTTDAPTSSSLTCTQPSTHSTGWGSRRKDSTAGPLRGSSSGSPSGARKAT